MAGYTFSTKHDDDTLMLMKIKRECEEKGINFSAYIITIIRKHEEAKYD